MVVCCVELVMPFGLGRVALLDSDELLLIVEPLECELALFNGRDPPLAVAPSELYPSLLP